MKNVAPHQRRKSISASLSFALMAVITALLAGFAVIAVVLSISRAEQDLKDSLASYQALAGSALASSVWNFDTHTVRGFTEALRLDPNVVFAQVRSEGSVIALSSLPDLSEQPVETLLEDPNYLGGQINLEHEGEMIGTFSVILSREGIRQIVWSQVQQIATVTVLILLAISLVSVLVANRFVARPLARLQDLAARIAEGKLDRPVAALRNDELGALSESLETMRRSLKQLVNDLRGANADLEQANATLEERVEERTAELTKANKELQDANRMILDSIRYASRIQEAVLPSPDVLGRAVDGHFLLWEPRDLVGGDFVWFHSDTEREVIIVGDCTGHGVPGAFMTLIAGTLLDRIFSSTPTQGPADVLTALNAGLKHILNQEEPTNTPLAADLTDDGLDAAICMIERNTGEMRYAGARLSLWCRSDQDVREIKGDKIGLGYRRSPMEACFQEHVLPLDPGETFYLTTDGMIDQVGGVKSLSFGRRRFRNALSQLGGGDMGTQADTLRRILQDYQGSQIRRDDVTVLGFATAGGTI